MYPYTTLTQMTDLLTTVTKTMLHDNIMRPKYRKVLFFLLYFMLCTNIQLAFDVNRKFATEERRDAEIKAIQGNEEYLYIL